MDRPDFRRRIATLFRTPRFSAETPIEVRVTTKPSADLMPEDNPMLTRATMPALAKAA